MSAMETPAANTEVTLLKQEVVALRAQVDWLKRQLFGRGKSETLDRLQSALALGEAVSASTPAKTETIRYERTVATKERRQLPVEVFKDLPVTETIELIPAEVKADPELFEKISEERTFEVDIIEPQLVKRVIIRPKYRHKLNRAKPPVIAPAPARPVSGGYASAGLLAYIVISKYQHHLPLYRLESMSAQWGAQLSRKSMADWVRIASEWAEPIYKLMHAELLRGQYVQCDETPVKFIDPDEKGQGTTQGYLWVVSAPGGDVVFDWRLTRRHGELTTLLTNDYTGLMQSDGYEAYAAYVRVHPAVAWVGCWAHARRRFLKPKPNSQESPRLPCG